MKALAQLLAAALAAAMPAIVGDGPTTTAEWINVVVLGLGAASVWIASNHPAGSVWAYTKAILSAVSAGGVVAISALTDYTVTRVEWFQIVAAIIGVLATYAAPGPDPVGGGRHELRDGDDEET